VGTVLSNAAPDGSIVPSHDDRCEWGIYRMIPGKGKAKFSREVLLQYSFFHYDFRVDCPELETHASAVRSRGLLSERKFWVTWNFHSACRKLMGIISSNLICFYLSRKSPCKLTQASRNGSDFC
jgi:hypothetical protein